MTIESLVALIPALPLVGFLFAVLVGPRIDRMPSHGHDAHGSEHSDDHGGHSGHGGESHESHEAVDESGFRTIPSEEEQRAIAGELQAIARAVDPSEIAATVLFLSSDEAAMITGRDIEVSGGRRV